jgi:hypothetical protein
MTIMATHFAIVLGAWRLRVRIDLDEPRESELAAEHGDGRDPGGAHGPAAAQQLPPRVATWGRG